jgi:hypothetical protein
MKRAGPKCIRGMAVLIGIVLASAFVVAAQAEPGTQSKLTAISGQGAGFVSLSPTSQDQGNLFVEDEVNIHDALPDTTFTVQRAVDFAPADVANGVCTIAPGPPLGWLTEATLTTSSGGAGSVHISGPRPPLSGTRFDIIVRVKSEDGTQVLTSDCMTVTVK